MFLALESWNQQPLSIEQFAGLSLPLFVAQSEGGAVEFKHAFTQQASAALFVRLFLELDRRRRQLTQSLVRVVQTHRRDQVNGTRVDCHDVQMPQYKELRILLMYAIVSVLTLAHGRRCGLDRLDSLRRPFGTWLLFFFSTANKQQRHS